MNQLTKLMLYNNNRNDKSSMNGELRNFIWANFITFNFKPPGFGQLMRIHMDSDFASLTTAVGTWIEAPAQRSPQGSQISKVFCMHTDTSGS